MDLDDLSALLGESVDTESAADIWAVAPRLGSGEGARLIGEARRLADGLGCYVHALVGDEAAAQTAVALGADRAHVVAEPASYLAQQQPEFVLFAENDAAAAAQYAQRAGAGLITGVRGGLRIEDETRALLGAHPVYEGAYLVDRAATSATKVATVTEDTLPAPAADASRSGETVAADVPSAEPSVRDLGPAEHQPPDWRPLSKARVIVAAGRGVRDEAGFALVRALAEALGAELAGDRSALSSGWIDEAHEVGVTGQEVAPDVYVAVGVLGDTLHNAAIAGARRVIAVHPNADAPIFKVADVAVVAEPKTWLPVLLEALAGG